MIRSDIHTHTYFSGDSKEPMENMIQAAIANDFNNICFTEHMDMDFPENPDDTPDTFIVDIPSYQKEFKILRDKYSKKINLLFGLEIGLQPHLAGAHSDLVAAYDFDFVIGSEHTTNRRDPYYPAFYEGRTEKEAYEEYFMDIVTNIKAFDNFDSLGHLDYVVRYGPTTNKNYSYSKYSDYIDEILKLLVDRNIALEANTGGYKYGLGEPNPCRDILKRYKELGGQLLTIGSDAHDSSRIGSEFPRLEALLTDLGYKYYTVFKERRPIQIKF